MLFEKLPEKDVRILNRYINEYGTNPGASHGEIGVDMEYLLRFWSGAKSDYLYTLLNNQFILEKDITYKVPLERIYNQISVKMSDRNSAMRVFRVKFFDLMQNRFGRWISDDNYLPEVIRELMNTTHLAENKMRESEYGYKLYPAIFEFDDGVKVKVEITSKPMRVLGKLAKILGIEEEYEAFRIEHSQILNQKDLSGTLCLSIHPMDYLTMSDNLANWSSCMSWTKTGCYRMGTVEMMNSPCVVVAYLRDDKTASWEWNNKHWRCLFIVDRDFICSIKGYPYYCEELTIRTLDWLKELAAANLNWSFGNTQKLQPDEDSDTIHAQEGWSQEFYPECDIMYNDFYCTVHWGAFRTGFVPASPIRPNYSGEAECMSCGRQIGRDDIYDEGFVYCSDCSPYHEGTCCDRCGEYYDDDDIVWMDGYPYCPQCAEEIGVYSELDGCYHLDEYCVAMYLTRKANELNISDDVYTYVLRSELDSLHDHYGRHLLIAAPHYDEESGFYYVNREDVDVYAWQRWFSIYYPERYFV